MNSARCPADAMPWVIRLISRMPIKAARRDQLGAQRRSFEMIPTLLLTAIFCLVMALPYLPGRFDASAATFSFVVQVASYVSLLMVPLGTAWIINPRRSRLWHRLVLGSAGLVVFVITIAAASMNQLSVGVMLGFSAVMLIRTLWWRSRDDSADATHKRKAVPFCLVWMPLILVTFQATVLPSAAIWSRGRAIQNSALLVAEIESFRQSRGHYPVSLQSLNPDVPTGIVGIERFHYEPNGESYNLFFVRLHTELDAKEVVMFNPRDEHRFASHELDVLQYNGEQLDLRRGHRRRTRLTHPHWISIVFD